MRAEFLPLLAVVPLFFTALTAVARTKFVDRAVMIATPLGTLATGVVLLGVHRDIPVIAHSVGNYLEGVAIVFVTDTFTALMLTITGLVTLFANIYLIATAEDRYRVLPPLVTMLTAGVNGALLTGDLFNLFVFIEVMLLPSYALLAITGTWRRLGVGRMFLLVNLTTSTVLVIGIGLVYGVTGTVNLAALAGTGNDPRTALAFGVVILALLAKAGAAPMHTWLVRAYPATSAGIMALFSGLHTKIGLYALYRIYTTVFVPNSSLEEILLVIVVVTVLIGAQCTFAERRIRGALAYQMVAGVGQIIIALVVFTQFSLAAGMFYMVHHMLTMASLVMGAGAIEATYGSGRFDRIHGLMRREPVLASVMAFGFLSLVGLPPTSGLWAKVLLLGSAARTPTTDLVALVGAVVVAAVLSMLALQHVWRRVFFGQPMKEFLPDDPVTSRGKLTPLTDDTVVPKRLIVPPMALIVLSIILFLVVGSVWPIFESAANGLLDPLVYKEAVLG